MAHENAGESSDEANGERLHDELEADIVAAGSDGTAHADLPRSLENACKHDVHDPDALHEERDPGNTAHDNLEESLGAPALLQKRFRDDDGVVPSASVRKLERSRPRSPMGTRLPQVSRRFDRASSRAVGDRTSVEPSNRVNEHPENPRRPYAPPFLHGRCLQNRP